MRSMPVFDGGSGSANNSTIFALMLNAELRQLLMISVKMNLSILSQILKGKE